jgi:hypothetical protein
MKIIICFIGFCAVMLLFYYVYVLMKGDEK